jgi:hypothetical protein
MFEAVWVDARVLFVFEWALSGYHKRRRVGVVYDDVGARDRAALAPIEVGARVVPSPFRRRFAYHFIE